MPMMEPPPSRYRVIERGGRLVVIDSTIGGAPPTARELLPDGVTDDGAAMSLQSYPREREDGGEATIAPRPLAAQALIAKPPGLLRNVAATVCGERRDDSGRLRWTTARWFDAKGPRDLILSEKAERQLGFGVLTLIAAAIVAVFLVILGDMFGWAIVFFAFIALSQMKPGATAWIDRMARG